MPALTLIRDFLDSKNAAEDPKALLQRLLSSKCVDSNESDDLVKFLRTLHGRYIGAYSFQSLGSKAGNGLNDQEKFVLALCFFQGEVYVKFMTEALRMPEGFWHMKILLNATRKV